MNCVDSSTYPSLLPNKPTIFCSGPFFSIGVLLTSKAIYEEAVDVLYLENKFMLEVVAIGDIPLFDFSRIRSLQINAGSLIESGLEGFEEFTQNIKLHPDTRLSVFASDVATELKERFSRSLECLGPVQSCSVSFMNCDNAKPLSMKIAPNTGRELHFSYWTQLPTEIRSHILSFTDLVQMYAFRWNGLEAVYGCCLK